MPEIGTDAADLRQALDVARREAEELRAALHAVSVAYGAHVFNGTRGVHGPWRQHVDPTIYRANKLLRERYGQQLF